MVRLLIALTSAAGVWRGHDRGATAVGYGLMIAIIALLFFTAVLLVGDDLKAMFASVGSAMADGAEDSRG